jgi:hypothetical protein
MDLNELPPLCEALINREEVQLLFSDLADHAENIQLFHKGAISSAEQRAASHPTSLQIAGSAFLLGHTPRLQIRYSWNGADWIDTLETKDAGYRLIRIEHRKPS